jgi:GWxTD domain-containing protein
MKFLSNIVILVLVAVFQPTYLHAQAEIQPEQASLDLPQFYFDALSFASDQPGLSRLDVYLEVPYEQLHFANIGQLFTSSYEITMSFYDKDNKLVDEKWWKKTVETGNYNESISAKQSDMTQRSFMLPPKQYTLVIQISDSDTKKMFRRKRDITVKNFASHSFSASDVMIARRVSEENNNKVVYPNVSGNVGDSQQGTTIFFEAYNRMAADSAIVYVNILNKRNDIVARDTCTQVLDTARTACFCQIHTSHLPAGEYKLSVETVPHSSALHVVVNDSAVTSTRSFEIHWRGLPSTVVDLDIALDQMQYVMEKEELEKIKLMDNAAKREKFFESWKRKDPTPGTERNELMEEYFSRVEYANKHFTHYFEGWKTDMGMVYIIFGTPSNIERHPFDIDARPYEIWTYYENNREFIFVDISGFGDYKLQTPIWDVFGTRPR